jgi:cobalt-zinc-cadmium efflux system protein
VGTTHYAEEGRAIRTGILINALFFMLEATVGVVAGSVALTSDAVHDLSDVFSLGLAWYATKKAAAPRTDRMTWGYHRTTIIVAFVNSIVLVLLALIIFYSSYRRILDPSPVRGDLVLAVAVIGILANGSIVYNLYKKSRGSPNVKSIMWHMAEDALGWCGVLVSGIVLVASDFYAIDAIVGIAIGCIVVWGAYQVLRETAEILLESAPIGMDMQAVRESICSVGQITSVHDLHVWSLGATSYALSAHVTVPDMRVSETRALREQVQGLLREQYGIAHATLTFETADDACSLPH